MTGRRTVTIFAATIHAVGSTDKRIGFRVEADAATIEGERVTYQVIARAVTDGDSQRFVWEPGENVAIEGAAQAFLKERLHSVLE